MSRSSVWVLVVAMTGVACSAPPAPVMTPPPPRTLPDDFLVGTAIAGFQVEMGCPTLPASRCDDPNSDWYTWVTRPELVADTALHLSGDPVEAGPGFYELYPQDLDRAAQGLGSNTMRLSLEWSRIFPTSTVGLDGYDALHAAASADALAFYHALFAAMKARGLKPFVTLNHYTLPSWIHDAWGCHQDVNSCTRRGWIDRDPIVPEIAKYAGFAAQEFGGEVDLWATQNEPLVLLISAYLYATPMRSNPPGLFLAVDELKAAFVNMIEAHARMYDAVKAADTADADGDGRAAEVGLVYHFTANAPKDPSNPVDVAGAKNFQYVMNEAFLDGVVKGDLDAKLDGQPEHRADLAGRCDFLGMNYYFRNRVVGTTDSILPLMSPLLTFDVTKLEYLDDPLGLYDNLVHVNQRYGIPLYITETGHEDPNDDGAGGRWVAQTMQLVERAVREGIPLRGYYYWTLMDLYEWNHGMHVAGGLYAVDGTDPAKTRRARKSVAVLKQIASEGRVAPELVMQYPLP